MPSFIRSLIVEIGFFIIFEMEAKLRMGLEACPALGTTQKLREMVNRGDLLAFADDMLILTNS